jgi:tetratricopeptide (TPR) repeat protein
MYTTEYQAAKMEVLDYTCMSWHFRSVCRVVSLSLCLVAGGTAQESFEELLKVGVTLSHRADYADAIAALKKAKQLVPRSYAVNLLLGVDLLRSGGPKDAVGPLRLAAEINSKDGAPAAYLGEALAAIGDFHLAAEAFQDAIFRSPQSEEFWRKWADFDLERFRILGLQLRTTQQGMAAVLRVQAEGLGGGARDRADLLQRSALADPEQSGIWGELGAEQLRRGLLEQVAASLKMALDRQPGELWTFRLEAEMAAAQGDWRQAERHLLAVGSRSPAVLRKELELWPRNLVPGDDVRGEIWNCLRQGSMECLTRIAFPDHSALSADKLFAEQRWERLAAIPAPPLEDAPGWFRRGVAQAELADCPRAIPSLERGLDSGAEAAAFWLELCYASEAERTIDHLTVLGHQVTVHRLRGDILVRVRGDPKPATDEYLKAIRLEPRDPGLLERLAQAYMSYGDMQQARLAARRALVLDPNRALTLQLLASLAMNERDYSGALVFLNKMLATNPNNAWARVSTGIAYAQTGRPEEAIRFLQPALAAGYPDERGALHAALAGVLRKLAREQEAQRAVEEAKRLADRFQGGVRNSFDDNH